MLIGSVPADGYPSSRSAVALREVAAGDVAFDPVNWPLNVKLPAELPYVRDRTPRRR